MSGIVESCSNSSFNFSRTLHTILHRGHTNLPSHPQCTLFLFLHTPPALVTSCLFDDGHSHGGGGGHFCRLDRRFFEHDQRVPESGLPFRLPRTFFPDTCVTSSLASLRPLLKRLTSLRMSESLPWFPIYFCGGVFLRYLNQYDTRTYASFGFCH